MGRLRIPHARGLLQPHLPPITSLQKEAMRADGAGKVCLSNHAGLVVYAFFSEADWVNSAMTRSKRARGITCAVSAPWTNASSFVCALRCLKPCKMASRNSNDDYRINLDDLDWSPTARQREPSAAASLGDTLRVPTISTSPQPNSLRSSSIGFVESPLAAPDEADEGDMTGPIVIAIHEKDRTVK